MIIGIKIIIINIKFHYTYTSNDKLFENKNNHLNNYNSQY